jgi:hypothetical protein
MQWWFHRLTEGELTPGDGWDYVPSEKLYCAYIENLSGRSVHHRSGQTIFGMSLRKMLPAGWPQKHYRQVETDYPSIGGGKQVNHYRFPALEVCRKYFESLIKSEVDWGE